MKKTKITEEIEKLLKQIKSQHDTNPYYLLPELRELQTQVLISHMTMERAMEVMILIYFSISLKIGNEKKLQLAHETKSLSKLVPYMNKVKYLERKAGMDELLIESLKKLNTKRNDFAHLDVTKLKTEYLTGAPESKENVRNLLRLLSRVNRQMNEWFDNSKTYKEYLKITKSKI